MKLSIIGAGNMGGAIARGPMALPELTTYKYMIEGDGQIRRP